MARCARAGPASHRWLDASGQPGPVIIDGTTADEVIIGGDGDDTISGNGGNDTICGGPGTTTSTQVGEGTRSSTAAPAATAAYCSDDVALDEDRRGLSPVRLDRLLSRPGYRSRCGR